ncbi:MAG: exopolysaccharide biosynthesis polyprenyl glycosylphosphotransferase [Meiothermus sp.]|nr:exopolysaccharide biosynthesis polyprenyl glycosylphosphotransferase [Meiothermus sp.]
MMISAILTWDTWQFWRFEERRVFIGMLVLTYITGLFIGHRVLGFARADFFVAVFMSVSVSFLLAVTILAFGRFYYSRSFLLFAYLITLTWHILGWWLFSRRTLRLVLVPGGLNHQLSELPGVQWITISHPDNDLDADSIVIDPHTMTTPNWIRFVAENSLRGRSVFHAAAVYEALTGRISLEHHSEGWLENLSLPPVYPSIKRILDVCAVLITLPIILPLLGLVALLIRVDSSGAILFWQNRMGQSGRPFWMVKFRTMRIDSEQDGAQFAADDDPRITPLGRFLRKFRLDELPQFWNVLRGEMSLIGPRPEQVTFAEGFASEIPLYPYRHLVKPGLTGWAQVNQGYAADSGETRIKLSYDLYYVKNVSIWLDVLIVLKTLRTIVTGFGAR